MSYLKGKSTFMIFDKYVNLKYIFGKQSFREEGCCVNTLRLNESP